MDDKVKQFWLKQHDSASKINTVSLIKETKQSQ